MLHPEYMAKVTIIGPDTEMEKTIQALHTMGVLHIVDHVKKEDLDIGAPMERASMLSDLLVRTRALCTASGIKEAPLPAKESFSLDAIGKEIRNSEKKITAWQETIRDSSSEIKKKEEMKEKLAFLGPLQLNPELLGPYESIDVFAGYLSDVDIFITDLKKLTQRYHLAQFGNKIALFVEKEKSKDVQQLLSRYIFSPMDLSLLSGLKGNISENMAALDKAIQLSVQQKQKVLEYLDEFKEEHAQKWLKYAFYLEKELEKAEAPLKFAKTGEAFIIQGWVPEQKTEKTVEILNQATKGRLYIEKKQADKKDIVPVELENPKAVRPFEFLMKLYTLPSYKEIDPTFFLFMSFPLLFGFMLGDMGYGITSLILFWLLKKKFRQASAFFSTLMFASLATIFFGALFGEFFGEEVLLGYHLPHILSRADQLMLLLAVALVVGVIHVNMGIVLGFLNELKAHGFKKAFFEKISWIILQIGVALLAVSYLHYLPISPAYGYIVAIMAVVFLYIGEGINGMVELPGIFSNILSYARLMAIGLASVQLALVINEFAKEFFHAGGISIIWGILLLVVGHAINIIVGLLGSFLHSLRLHYVEFFTKFFKGGGTPFQAFGLKTYGG